LLNYTTWQDEYNIKGIQFTFSNGNETETTEVFGITRDKNGEKQKTMVLVNDSIKSV